MTSKVTDSREEKWLTVLLRILDHLIGRVDGVLQLAVVSLQSVKVQVQFPEAFQDVDGSGVGVCRNGLCGRQPRRRVCNNAMDPHVNYSTELGSANTATQLANSSVTRCSDPWVRRRDPITSPSPHF